MTHFFLDRVQATSSSTGAGALTLDAAAPALGIRTPAAAGVSNGGTFRALIQNQAVPTEWEISLAAYNSAGPSITRTYDGRSASSTGGLVAFSAGLKTISLLPSAGDVLARDNNGRVPQASFKGLQGIPPQALAIAAGVVAIDLSLGDRFVLTRSANITAYNFANLPADAQRFTIDFIGNGTAYTDIWTAGNGTTTGGSNTVYWPGDIAPVFSSANGKRDRIVFDWDGTHILGAIAGQSFAV